MVVKLKLKRAYLEPDAADGKRVLVDRIWPRGLTKEKAAIDLWIKEIAPSTELRKWFAHDREKWPEFRKRYKAELAKNPDLVNELRKMARAENITLIFAAKDEDDNNAVVLKEYLENSKA